MRLNVLFNADAGAGSYQKSEVEQALHAAGHTTHIIKARKNWREELEAEFDALVAVGGDGTVHKVLRAAAELNLPAAIVPTGTANNVALALGFKPNRNPLARIARWQQKRLVLAQVECRDKTRAVIEVVGAGAFARMRKGDAKSVLHDPATDVLTRIRHAFAYMVTHMSPIRVKARVDGEKHEGDYVLFECLNLPSYGPRLRLAPAARVDDSELTVIGVHAAQRAVFLDWLDGDDDDVTPFVVGRGSRITVDTEPPFHVDGKIWPKKKAGTLEIEGGATEVRIWI